MGRGRAQMVTCAGCAERIPRTDAIVADKPAFSYSDSEGRRYSAGFVKNFYCRQCGKRFRLITSKFRRVGGVRIGSMNRGRRY